METERNGDIGLPRGPSWIAAPVVAAAVGLPGFAVAGPPFATDDPVPTDRGHWEIYSFAAGVRIDGATGGQAGLDLNYGGATDLQLTAVIPLGYDTGSGAVGLSNVELAAKYRFLHEQGGTATPDLAFFPRVITPTGGTRLGTGHAQVLLPVWAGKDIGGWSLFGGGGYTLNPGRDRRSFWLGGIGVVRAVSERLSLGVEVYRHTRDTYEATSFTGLNVGALYRLTDHWSLIGSAGPGLQNARREGQSSFYAALKADY